MPDKNTKLPETLTWSALSHAYQKRSFIWYVGFAIISVGLIIFAIFSQSVLTIITFGLIIAVILIVSIQPPRQIQIRITKFSIDSGAKSYPFKVIKSFWILYKPPGIKTLNIETTAYVNHQISFELGNMDPMLVKNILSQYLHEDLDREEGLADILARSLKI